MADPLTNWQAFVETISHPLYLMQGTIEYLQAWFSTRRWFAIVAFLPAAFVLVITATLVGSAFFIDDAKLVERYATLAEGEATAISAEPAEPDDKATLLKDEPVSAKSEMLLRRVLQIEKSNVRAKYLIAAHLAKSGRQGQARQMMRSIAPQNRSGFAPAHAWLAADRLVKGQIVDHQQKMTLLHDLEIGCTWNGANPIMRAALSQLLESEGKIGEAIAVLTEAAKSEPELNVRLANLAHRHGRKQALERAAGEAKRMLQQRVAAQNALPDDYFALANMFLLEQNAEAALQITSMGLAKYPENPQLKRMASETHRFKYVTARGNLEKVDTNTLAILDAALKADPTNPAVTQEVARIISIGESTTPELNAALEAQLANGQATVMTHLLLGSHFIKSGNIAKAIPHYELALRVAPNSPLILNNLALAIALTQPEHLSRADELISQAIALVKNSAEQYDTQGQIRMLQGDKVGAITSFETAIELENSRVETRKKLAAAYEAAGMTEMVKAQQREIAKALAQPPTTPTEP